MLRALPSELWVIDGEWVPDPVTGRRVHGLPAEMPDREVVEHLWKLGGATPENPRPYLKVMFCRLVALTALVRRVDRDGQVTLQLRTLPDIEASEPMPEIDILQRFWSGVSKTQPQFVGYNVGPADIAILAQRALIHGIVMPKAFARPAKPWEGVDYFDDKNSSAVVDLKHLISPWDRRDAPRLTEICRACGIPGKVGIAGDDVFQLWQDGAWRMVGRYNQCDVLSSYLLWQRMALMSGRIDTHAAEQERSQLLSIASREADGTEGGLIRTWLTQAA